MGQRNLNSDWIPRSNSAHDSGLLNSSTRSVHIHQFTVKGLFQARLPLGHHRWGRSCKNTSGVLWDSLTSAFPKHLLSTGKSYVTPRWTRLFTVHNTALFCKPFFTRFRYHHIFSYWWDLNFHQLMGAWRAPHYCKRQRLHLPFTKWQTLVGSSHARLPLP